MNNRRLGKLLKKHFPDSKIDGQLGMWQIQLLEDQLPEDKLTDDKPTDDDDAESVENAKPTQATMPVDAKPADDSGGAEKTNGKPAAKQENKRQGPAQEDIGPGSGERIPPVLLVLTDERANRMRIMIAIRPFNPQRVEDLQLALIALQANYDRALDARYAVHDGILWSAFLHPLSSLTPADLANAISQVRTLRETTGTTYSSGDLIFAAPVGEKEAPGQKGPKSPRPRNSDDNIT